MSHSFAFQSVSSCGITRQSYSIGFYQRIKSDMKSLHSNLQDMMQNRTLSREIRFAAAEVLEVGFTLLYPSPRSRSSFLSELIRSHVDKPMDSDDANLHLLRRLLLMFSSFDGVVSLLPTGSSNSDDDIVDLIRLLFESASRDEAAIALLRTYQRILISQVSDNRKDILETCLD